MSDRIWDNRKRDDEDWKFSVGDRVMVKYLVDNGRGHTNWLDYRDAIVKEVYKDKHSKYGEDYQYKIEFIKESYPMIEKVINVYEREIEFCSKLEEKINDY